LAEDERDLIDRARRGDETACRALVERHERDVAGAVIGMLGPGDEADDVGQETFVRFFRSLGRFRGEASVSTYLQRIAINLSLNALKRQRRGRSRFVDADDAGNTDHALAVDEGRIHDAREIHEMVHAALGQLPDKLRPVVVLRMIDGLSTRETATVLEIPEGTVLSRLARAMAQLEKRLAPFMREGEG
jgi:RNA polymerase sigma-70 factor (ECF subfamily)